jgi:hypothetical protein
LPKIAATVCALLVVGVGALAVHRHLKAPSTAVVSVSDTTTSRHLWSRHATYGYAVVLAVTPRAALVADGDECIHQGPAVVEILGPSRTTLVSETTACALYRMPPSQGVYAHVSRGLPHRLVVEIPSILGGGVARLPCPCPGPAPSTNGSPVMPARFGATEALTLGTFVPGAD